MPPQKLVLTVLGGFLALTLAAGSGCNLVVKHLAGQAVKKVVVSGYHHLKEDREQKSRVRKAPKHPTPTEQPQNSESRENAEPDTRDNQ